MSGNPNRAIYQARIDHKKLLPENMPVPREVQQCWDSPSELVVSWCQNGLCRNVEEVLCTSPPQMCRKCGALCMRARPYLDFNPGGPPAAISFEEWEHGS